MNDNKRLKNYDDLPLVLDVADIRRIMGISRVSAYELVHTPGFPAFRSGRLIKVSKKAFFDWMEKGTETVPKGSFFKSSGEASGVSGFRSFVIFGGSCAGGKSFAGRFGRRGKRGL